MKASSRVWAFPVLPAFLVRHLWIVREKRGLGRRGGFVRDKGSAVGWGADEGLIFGPSAVRDDRDRISGVIGQLDGLAFVGQPVADAPVVSIDGDGESRRVAAAEEDDV